MFSLRPRARCSSVRSPSHHNFGAWSFTSGPSQNGDAGSHSVAPRRRRLATLQSSLPPSSTQEYQTASRSPFGHSAIAGL